MTHSGDDAAPREVRGREYAPAGPPLRQPRALVGGVSAAGIDAAYPILLDDVTHQLGGEQRADREPRQALVMRELVDRGVSMLDQPQLGRYGPLIQIAEADAKNAPRGRQPHELRHE